MFAPLDELTMEPCCALRYYPAVDACQCEKVGEKLKHLRSMIYLRTGTQKPKNKFWSRLRRRTLVRALLDR